MMKEKGGPHLFTQGWLLQGSASVTFQKVKPQKNNKEELEMENRKRKQVPIK